ncbi:MAG: hypothetical protein KAW67_08465, partial [Candidatus Eisenbacteria sp.]|nr:hypothetical protein [Candidatus Eisenbacteria bacterium]
RATDATRAYWNVHVPGVTVSAADMVLDASIIGDVAPGGDDDGSLEAGETAWLTLTLEDAGPIGLEGVSGALSTSDAYVVVTDSEGEFGDIAGSGGTGTSSANSFRVNVSPTVPPGHEVSFTLAVTGDADTYTHTQNIDINVTIGGDPSAGPSGPDAYGYHAYDTSDGWTGQAPVYDWVEISGVGNVMSLIDGDAATTTISLPFTFRYYGTDYTNISVCSNGFLALGSEDYRFGDNSGIPDNHGPEAMVAPFWEDLNPAEDGDIYEYFDSANHRWICQFDAVAHYGGGNLETFEVILYDPAFYPVPSGDGDIVLQYQTVAFPYSCTVGIENPGATTGIQYLYNSTYDPSAAAIVSGEAVRFTMHGPDVPPQWLVIDSSTIDDSASGNGDGLAQPREEIDIIVTLQNLGSGDATSVTGTLTTSDPDVTIDDGSGSFGNIAPLGFGDNSASPFRVTIAESP